MRKETDRHVFILGLEVRVPQATICFFSVVGPYRVRSKVGVSINYDFTDFLQHKVGFTAYSE